MKPYQKYLTLTLLLSGCANTGFISPPHPFDYTFQGKNGIQTAIETEAFDKKIDQYYASESEDARKKIRNEITGKMKIYIDEYWRRFVSSFYSDSAISKATFETSTISLSTASTIVDPTHTKSILAGLASIATATGSSIDNNIYQKQTASILLKQMGSDVITYGKVIENGFSKSDASYPLPQALSDLNNYAICMTIPHALQELDSAAGVVSQSSKQHLIANQTKESQ
ncbi:hypothetical protein [Chromobacterium vaccinii]|uniref:hypothetical protein n=1 Tax=Chromobacterium vaccinii TaxID=1108595 RepID=UPI001E4C4A63|nr:hypothetical protein [Chromobacterium vaccinii]MCD4499399.1 hypothetical protein [Chromobacterium vaccinii]